jgi:hypothetical protein
LGLRGDGGAAKDRRPTVIQGDGVIGKPGAEGFSTAVGDGLPETAFEFKEEKGTGGEGRLGEWAGAGIGECAICWSGWSWRNRARHNWNGGRRVLRREWANRNGKEEKAEQGGVVHGEYAISRKLTRRKWISFVG